MNTRKALAQTLVRAVDPLPGSLTQLSDAAIDERARKVLATVDRDAITCDAPGATPRSSPIEITSGPARRTRRVRLGAPWMAAAAILALVLVTGTALLLTRSQTSNTPAAPNGTSTSTVQRTTPTTSSTSALGSRAAQAAVMQCEASATSALQAMIGAYEGASGSSSARNSAALHALQGRRLGSQQANEITAMWNDHRAELLHGGPTVAAADLARLCQLR